MFKLHIMNSLLVEKKTILNVVATIPAKQTIPVYKFLAGIVFLVLIMYALMHTFEYDEAWTYLSVKNQSLFELISYKNFNIANNHLLNSLWFRLLQSAGVKSVFLYRCASLASFVAYAFFLYKAVTYNNDFWRPKDDWYLSLFFLPPVIFFFAMGRGYSIAIASFCASLYYLKVFVHEKNAEAYWLFFVCGVLSCVSIVSFFFPFVAMFLYAHLKTYKDHFFSVKTILSGLILLAVTSYIYYIGKTILLHDTIINGTDNLFVYGMYSTFISFLNISSLVFPDKDLYASINLGFLSKALVLLTLIPVLWIFIYKHLTRHTELILLFITTLLFLASHVILHSKYPSDRSVLYLLYLIYIPVILHIAQYQNKFFKLHFYSVLLFALINFVGFIIEITKPTIYSFLKKQPVTEYSIASDWPNLSDEVYNDFYFGNRLKFTYIVKPYETNFNRIDSSIRSDATNLKEEFLLIQKPNFLRNKTFFDERFTVQPIMSSNFKDFYLIQRRPQ